MVQFSYVKIKVLPVKKACIKIHKRGVIKRGQIENSRMRYAFAQLNFPFKQVSCGACVLYFNAIIMYMLIWWFMLVKWFIFCRKSFTLIYACFSANATASLQFYPSGVLPTMIYYHYCINNQYILSWLIRLESSISH